jgi:hypothetical protein
MFHYFVLQLSREESAKSIESDSEPPDEIGEYLPLQRFWQHLEDVVHSITTILFLVRLFVAASLFVANYRRHLIYVF